MTNVFGQTNAGMDGKLRSAFRVEDNEPQIVLTNDSHRFNDPNDIIKAKHVQDRWNRLTSPPSEACGRNNCGIMKPYTAGNSRVALGLNLRHHHSR